MITFTLKNKERIEIDEITWELEIENQSGIKGIKCQDIVQFVNESPYNIYYMDEKFNTSTNRLPDMKYLILNSGFKFPGRKYHIYISMIYNRYGDVFFGGFLGSIEYLMKKINDHQKLKKTEFSKKLQRIQEKVFKELSENANYPDATEIVKARNEENNNTIKPTPVVISGESTSIKSIMDKLDAEFTDDVDSNNSNTKRTSTVTPVIPQVVHDIYDMLLINNWKQEYGLSRYIKIIGDRIQQLKEQNRTEYYIINKINSVIVNTGLLDKYNSDILLLYRWYENPGTYKPDKIIESKRDIIEAGFTMDQTYENISPINFIDGDMYLNNVKYEQFDITQRALHHILQTRIDRFPEEIRNLPIDVIAGKINQSLQIGVKMLQRDHTYARPSYSGKLKKICWLMPLYINRSFSDEPELVMVISKEEYFYEVKTIFVYDDSIKDRITAMELYRIGW